MEQLLTGFWIVVQPVNLLMLLIGMMLGLIVGVLPGVGGPMGVALLIPITFTMQPIQGILIMVALYVTATYGGSITSILFKIPGEAPAIVTAFDGYEMTKKGQAGKALGTAIFSSCLGGTFSVIVLVFTAPMLASVALKFGDAEYFAMAVLGLSVSAGIGGGTFKKNAIAAMMGLFFATWGIDEITGHPRYTFGTSELLMGLTFIPAAIGIFAIGEVFEHIETELKRSGGKGFHTQEKVRVGLPTLAEMVRMKWLYLRSAILGTLVGILPGVGATTASFFGYSEAVRWSKEPRKYGTGIIEGVAAPETANNAACGGAMVPLLTLGIPGSGVTAVMIGAFVIHGIRPGPMMMAQQPKLVYAIFAGLFISNFLIIIAGLIGIRFMVKVLDVRYSRIGPAILLFAVVGSYALRNSMVDVWISVAFGVLGYFMRKYKFGLAPLILGLILGPLCETSFQRAMVMANYNPMTFVNRPISAGLLLVALASTLYPLIKDLFSRRKQDAA
jgi:putative tricarboxylic transport membrane protein